MEDPKHTGAIKEFLVRQFTSRPVVADVATDLYVPILDLGRVYRALTADKTLVRNYTVTQDEVLAAVDALQEEGQLHPLCENWLYAITDPEWQGRTKSHPTN